MDKSLIVVGVAFLIAGIIIVTAILIQNAFKGSDSNAGGPGISFKKPNAKWLIRAILVVAVIVIVIWLGPPVYRWVAGLKFSNQENTGRPVSEETMLTVMAPPKAWSRSIVAPGKDTVQPYLCPTKGKRECSDYNTDMTKLPFLVQCQRTRNGSYYDWSMGQCEDMYAFRLKSKSDQPVRVGYWFERITH